MSQVQATTNGQKTLSAQERQMLFAQSTRQNFQTLPSKRVTAENETVQFTLPKVRLLSRIFLQVEAVATLTSTAATIAQSSFSPFNILRRVSLDLNNGFSPFIVNGKDLYLYNLVHDNSDVLAKQSNPKGNTFVENTSTAGGRDNKIKFTLNLPLTLNERDATGLVLLQNEETNVTLSVDVDTLANAYTLNAGNGDKVAFKSMTITPMVETFSIPPLKQAFPSIDILKLVSSRSEKFGGNGSNVVKLATGTIYRKMILQFTKDDGSAYTDDDFTGNIELVFNQADIPYSVRPSILSAYNHQQFGHILPNGVYVFDFSYQGISGLGGSRDYIDTERLTEFWVRFNSNIAGTCTVISETLSRLRTQ